MSTSSILQPDDLEIGMCITVLRGKLESINGFPGSGRVSLKERTNYKGKVLEVVAIDLPFIVVNLYQSGIRKPTKKDFNVGEVLFKKLSQEYVDALLNREPRTHRVIKKFKAPEA